MAFNDVFSDDRRQLCPHKDILDKSAYYNFGDCPNYGSSDCNIAMGDDVCYMERRELEETLCYKYR